MKHMELIAALLSGVIVLTAWLIEGQINQSTWVILHLIAFAIGGFYKAKEGITETIANKQLNVEMLMVFAAVGSAIIGYWTEGAILIFIFALSGALETYTMNKSEREISSLMNLQPEKALRITNGSEQLVDVRDLQIGDTIFVKAGERIPADGMITNGTTSIDESAITGESIPVSKQLDENVFAGTVNLNGSIEVEITKTANESLFQKIINLVQSAQSEKSPSQQFIERFEGTYVHVVLISVVFVMFLPHFLLGWSWVDSIYRAIVLLVVASPCALVASIMPATLSAISHGARKGVLFKGGVHLETLSHVGAVALDKTGTLTNGKPVVTDVYFQDSDQAEEILAIVHEIERQSNHPLAQAIVHYCESQASNHSNLEVEEMQDISGNGVTAKIGNQTWKIGKADFVGKEEALQFHSHIVTTLAEQAKSLVFVANDDGVVAVIALKDTIRQDTLDAIKRLKEHGIHTVMLTGDNQTTAGAIAKEAGVDEFIAECLPEDKVAEIKKLQDKYKHVAMIGDGINDAPALATADVGIAMGAGTDVALETSDIVLMKNKLDKISHAVSLSNRMNRIVKQNVVFSIGVILLLVVSNFLQVLDLPLGVIGHEGSTILVILNGLRLLR
nr:heavy metal translocating P-type ATPase [Aquibacillus sediminis]